ncbi:hypothetical protein [Clostridium botulinum]|nr:hypothetical protein [Clostridium botulinum]
MVKGKKIKSIITRFPTDVIAGSQCKDCCHNESINVHKSRY